VLALPSGFDVLVIDDGSPDGTASLVKAKQEHQERLHLIERSGKLGLGTAYICGFRWAIDHGYDYIFEMDADFSHNPADLERMLSAACNGADMVVGSRYKCGVNVVNWPMGRVIMSYYASRYVRLITGMPINDATAGFVCYSAKVLSSINLDAIAMRGYGFQIEMKYTVWRLGFNIEEISIIFTDRTLGTSKMNSGIFGEAFWGVLKLPLRKIRPKS
ncbi:MAG: polyprenol monophosphomannose synthase, partial [Rikenellaceae bacterium]|nr:polyprenol monophosphomannose synthase [Rikenellaceae bacterium]